MSIWRPFDYEPSSNAAQKNGAKRHDKAGRGRERMNIKVGEQEKQVAMVAYNQHCDQRWAAVLKRVQEKIEEVPLSSRVVDYYLERDEAIVIRRIKRIVREEMKEAARMTINNESVNTPRAPNAESGGSLTVRRQMKYAKKRTPEERREAKLLEFADIDSDEDVEETQAAPPKRKPSEMRH